MSLSFL